jgi:4-nitrophenyl phosphatase
MAFKSTFFWLRVMQSITQTTGDREKGVDKVTCDLLSSVHGLILDMDGVLWRDTLAIGDLPRIFGEIRKRGWKAILATNNATLSADQYIQKLARFGVSLEHWQIVNSSQATAHYLRQRYPQGGSVYIVGESGLEAELVSQGFFSSEKDPLAVIVGLDRGVTYEKLKKASLFIRAGARFIATNPDKTYPIPGGLAPGAGTFVAAIQAASDHEPLIIGKPEPEMYLQALERMGLNPEETLVVGDRLETDIAGAQRIGCPTALVLSGVSSQQEAEAWAPPPDCIAADLSSLLELT